MTNKLFDGVDSSGQVEGMSLQRLDVDRTASAWSSLAGTVFVPHSLEEYR